MHGQMYDYHSMVTHGCIKTGESTCIKKNSFLKFASWHFYSESGNYESKQIGNGYALLYLSQNQPF